jgi:hypothetical protein
VGRHHCWAAGPLGLGFPVSLYIVVHLYAIQSTVHSSTKRLYPMQQVSRWNLGKLTMGPWPFSFRAMDDVDQLDALFTTIF